MEQGPIISKEGWKKWENKKVLTRSRTHKRTIGLRFLGIILRVLRLEVSVYNVYITNQFQTNFAREGGGVGGGGIR
jgi:hypothetical protein